MPSFTRDRSAGALPNPTPDFADAFTRADQALDADGNWNTRTGSAVVESNQIKATSASFVAAANTVLGVDQWVSLASGGAWGICCRMGSSGTDRYEFGFDFNRYKIRKYVGAAVTTLLQSGILSPPTTPLAIELFAITQGSRVLLTGRIDGVAAMLITDASSPLTGTHAGLRCAASGSFADDFKAYIL